MFKHFLALACFFLFSISAFSSSPKIVIGVGDQLSISVYNESDLTVKVKVDDTGVVNFPLLGEVDVLDITPRDLARKIENQLLDGFLVNPLVTVLIERYRPFYIRGEVVKPGAYEYSIDLTVSQAIAIAGGLEERASRTNWIIIRGANERPIKADKETKLMPGDVLTIKSSFF